MKKQKMKKVLILIIILILCIVLILNINKNKNKFQDDIIFFKSFNFAESKNIKSENEKGYNLKKILNFENNENNENNEDIEPPKQIIFKVSYKNTNFKDINLSETINKQTLVNEKIAPGTSGKFEILLETNRKVRYEIKFESKNDKPQNLTFEIEGKDRKYKNLEDMEQDLQGETEKNKRIIINWKWEYEKNSNQDIIDTQDGEKLIKYNFTIYAIGQ